MSRIARGAAILGVVDMKRGALRFGSFGLLLLFVGTGTAFGQSPAVGSEFQANSSTLGNQYRGDVAADANGFVVVWTARTFSPPAPDGSGFAIFGQRFASAGTKLGTEFQVNSHTMDNQFEPKVAAAPNGDFVVVWRDAGGVDGSFAGIFGQRYDSGGAKLGEEFLVNSYTFTSQIQPEIASDANGDFVVVWASQLDSSIFGISGQRFASNGMQIGTEFQVNTFTIDRQDSPAVAIDSGGGFMVVWTGIDQDGDGYGIFAQQFLSNGAPTGGEIQVNTYTPDDQNFTKVAAEPGNVFVVVWQSSLQDGSSIGIFGQRFIAGGGPLGSEFLVNSFTVNEQYLPSVAGNTNGGFLVAWSSYGNEGDGTGVFARRFATDGSPIGDDFQVNVETYSQQDTPSVASRPNGEFVAVWQSFAQDGDERGMFGRPGPQVATPLSSGVPALSTWGLLASALAILVIGLWNLRRAQED